MTHEPKNRPTRIGASSQRASLAPTLGLHLRLAVDEKDWCDEKFKPNWGGYVTQELRDEDKRGADEWRARTLADERKAVDKQRDGGGSPLRGNRKQKATFLDEIDDLHYDYQKARATGYEESFVSPGWEDEYKRDEEIKMSSASTYPERASSSSVTRPKSFITMMSESSNSSPSIETNTCEHGVKMNKKKKCKKRKTLSGNDTQASPKETKLLALEDRRNQGAGLVPKYKVGDRVKFSQYEGGEWLFGWVREIIRPGEPGNTLEHPDIVIMYLLEHREGFKVIRDVILETSIDSTLLGPENKGIRSDEKPGKTALVVRVSLANSLHDLDLVGIDTCSAVSVSTEREDFIFIDESREAKDSVTLRGVGGSSSVIGGRGPMVVKTKDKEGNDVLMFDPSAVYLDPDELDDTQARFRIFGQTKLKRAGLKIVQDKYGDDEDYLVYRNGEMEIPMETIDDIITVRTQPLALTEEQNEKLGQYIEMVLGGREDERAFMKAVENVTAS